MSIRSSYAHRGLPTASMGRISAFYLVSKIEPVIAEWGRRRLSRADLKRLLKVGPYMIADIGLTYQEALDECGKPFWRP